MSVPKIFGLGTDYDISARTIFRGDSTKLVLQTGSTYPTDELGATTLTRKWKCRRDLVQSFMPARGDLDFLFRNLKVIDFDAVDEAAISILTVKYNGFINGAASPVKITRRTNQKLEATLYATLAGEGSIVVVYLAPTLTIAYATDQEPKFDDYYLPAAGFNDPIKPLFIRAASGIELDGQTSAFLKKFKFETRTIRTQLDPNPDGHVFRVTEVWQRQIVQAVHIDAPAWAPKVSP